MSLGYERLIKHHAMKTRGGPEVYLPHIFLSSALGGGGQFNAPAALPSCLEYWKPTVKCGQCEDEKNLCPHRDMNLLFVETRKK